MGYTCEKSNQIEINYIEINSMIYWIILKIKNNNENEYKLINLEIFEGKTEIKNETNIDIFNKFNK